MRSGVPLAPLLTSNDGKAGDAGWHGLNFPGGGGEMGARITAFDWAQTPAGSIETWPQNLRTAAQIMLASRYPMFIWWGESLINIYNDAYAPVLAKRHPSALGKSAPDVWKDIWGTIGPQAEAVFRGGSSTWNEELLLVMDRNDFTEETYFTFSYSPIAGENGIAGMLGVCTEDTARVLGRRRLKTLRDLGESTLTEGKTVDEAIGAAVSTLGGNHYDLPFALVYLLQDDGKAAKLARTIRCEDISRAVPELVALPGSADIWDFRTVLETGKMQIVDGIPGRFGRVVAGAWPEAIQRAVVVPLARSGGQEVPAGFLVSGLSPRLRFDEDYRGFLELAGGQIAAAIANARAYQDERRRAEALADIDRAKTAFFSNVSHEFRTPLTLMLGPLESVLSAPDKLPADSREQLQSAHRNSLRLLKLVNSLLDFSRIEAGRMRASYVPADIAALTADLASGFRSAMEAAGLELAVECPPLSQPVYLDCEMWEKIVLNLLSNAFKFTFSGSVTVRLGERDDYAVLTVSDTGAGIPEAELPRIFDRFHRVEGAKGRTHEGAGIGLALVQELVRLHGGSISAVSQEGEGSTFTITVPFGVAHLPAEHIRSEDNATHAATGRAGAWLGEALTWLSNSPAAPAHKTAPHAVRGRILLADDNADMRDHVVRVLGQEFDVTTAIDGEQALELIRRDPPDVVVADVMMPRRDGFELLRAVREDAATQTLPVILLSARAGEDARVEGLDAGADDYIVKPFTANELRARVGTHIAMTQARKRAVQRESALRAEAEAARNEAVTLLESVTDGFVAMDREWRFTYVNAEAERLNGMRREQMLGRKHWELFPAAVGATLYKEMLRVMKQRVSSDFESYYAPWDRWFHIRAYPAADGGISAFYEDITPRKRAEQERDALMLRERAARDEAETLNEVSRALAGELDFHKLLQKVTDAATRLTGAKFGAFFYNVNEGGEAYMLYTLSGAPRDAFDKLEMPRNTPVFHATFSGLGVVRTDDVLTHPDYGKWAPHFGMPAGHLPVRSYLAVPVKARSGKVLGGLFFGHPDPGMFTERAERLAIGIASHAAVAIDNAHLFQQAEREIAQRKETELSLRRSEERFRGVFNSSAVGVAVLTLDARFIQANAAFCEITGYSEEELKSLDSAALTHEEDHPAMRRQLELLVSGRIPTYVIEKRYLRKDGRVIWVKNSVSLMRDAQGRPENVITLCEDINWRRRVEALISGQKEALELAVSGAPLGNVLEVLARTAQMQSDDSRAAILITDADGEHLRFGAMAGMSESYGRAVEGLGISPQNPSCGLAAYTGQTVIAADVEQDPLWTPWLAVAREHEIRASWSQPVHSGTGKPIGTIAIYHRTPRKPEARELESLRYLAHTAAILLERHKEAEERQKYAQRQQTLSDALASLLATDDPESVIRDFFPRVAAHLSVDTYFNYMVDGDALSLHSYAGIPEQAARSIHHLEFGQGICGTVAQIRQPITANDIQHSDDAKVSIVRGLGIQAYACNPLMSGGRLLGTLSFASRDRTRFDEAEVEFLGLISSYIALAMDRAEQLRDLKRSVQAVQAAEQELRLVADVAPVYLAHCDCEGRFVFVNRAYAQRFGVEPEQIAGKHIAEVVGTAAYESFRPHVEAVLRGETVSFEADVPYESIPARFMHVSYVPERDAAGNVSGLVAALTDITDRKLAEEALHRSEYQYRMLFNSMDEGFCTIEVIFDENEKPVDYRFLETNAAFERQTGIRGAKGKRMREIAPLHEEQWFRIYGQIALTGQPARFENEAKELGRWYDVYAFRLEPSELRRVAVLFNDVTERHRREKQLLEASERLRFMAESMPQKIFTTTPAGDVDYFNGQWMEFTGLTFSQIKDWGWMQFIHPDDLEENLRLWRRSLATGEPFQYLHRFRRADGAYRWHLTRAHAMRDEQGRISMWIGSNTEIHEQKQTEEDLRRANNDLEQFAYSASHDLQEPLRSISIYSELLSSRYRGKLDGDALMFLGYLRSGAIRMEMLVRDLLAYTQVTRIDLPVENSDSGDALKGALANLSEAVAESGAQIVYKGLPSLPVHSLHLKQLFQNLVGNAIKYRKPEVAPVVHISAQPENGCWLFSVSDNGIGIEPQYRERIFGLFKRLHSHDQYSGTGIGLAICQRIVERYHGRIWVDSETGEGSVFRFTLPV